MKIRKEQIKELSVTFECVGYKCGEVYHPDTLKIKIGDNIFSGTFNLPAREIEDSLDILLNSIVEIINKD